jgi:hypothetical protein
MARALTCTQTAAGWAGSCRFDAPGTYGFVCGLHAYMSGTVAVVDPTATTPTGTTTTPTGTTPAPSRPTVRVARSQRGTVVRGSVATAATGSRIVATALVAKRALAARRLVGVGSQSKRSKGIGRTALAVRLNARARAALVRRPRLAVELRVVVTPPAGQAVTKTFAVTLRYR